jgi:hypothetical protein
MFIRTIFLTSLLVPLSAITATAQTTDPTQIAHLSAANQLGILEYCQGEGYTDQSAVDAEKKSISMLPASSGPPDTSSLADAESTGKQGSFLLNGNKTPLTKIADGKNTTVKSLCAQMGTATKNAVANMGSMNNGMPAMPNGMQMPSVPNGMQMPSMSGMPASPSNSQ